MFISHCTFYTHQISTLQGNVACTVASVTCYGMAKHATTVLADAVSGEMSGEKNLCADVEI
jgi:hypothetical protein